MNILSSVRRSSWALATAVVLSVPVSTHAALTKQQLRIETELSTQTGGAATLDAAQVPPKRFPTSQELADATASAIRTAIAQNKTEISELITGAAVAFDRSAAPLIVNAAVNADITARTSLSTARSFQIVSTTFLNSDFVINHQDRPAVAAAIVANALSGMLVTNPPSNDRRRLVKQMTAAAVAAAYSQRAVTGGRPLIDVFLGGRADLAEGGTADGKAQGTLTAGATTGLVSQISNTGDFDGSGLLKVIVKIAIKNAPDHYDQIVQAAATAAAYISGNSSSFSTGGGAEVIRLAAIEGLQLTGATVTNRQVKQIQQALNFGVSQAGLAIAAVANGDSTGAGKFGAGAAGVSNYAHFNCTGPAVTDVSGL